MPTKPRRQNTWWWALVSAVVALATMAAGCSGASSPTATPSSPAASGTGCADFAPAAPQDVINTAVTDQRSVTVTWKPPAPGCAPAARYDIVEVTAEGSPVRVVKSVSASGPLSATVTGLFLCNFYSYGVEAASDSAIISAIGLPAHPAFTYGLPDPSPPVVSIVLQGIASAGDQGSFDPSQVDYCTSPDGSMPPVNGQLALKTLATRWTGWDSPDDPSRAYGGAGNNLIDSLASTGGYVLPFSYTGATVTGTPGSPWFTVNAYSKTDVANSTIPGEQARLGTLITDVHKVWPLAKIIVVGHSNGGLIAEQWWLNNRSNLQGVTQIFSLDSPLNGVARADQCLGAIIAHACAGFGVGPALSAYYANLWANQVTNDPYWAREDAHDKVFTAVYTLGDPLYDAGDWTATNLFGVKNIGTFSQMYIQEPSCSKTKDPSSPDCAPIGRAAEDKCGPLDDSTGPFFGAPKDLPLHSVVKNCPKVISVIMGYMPTLGPAPAPKPACTAAALVTALTGPSGEEPAVPVGSPRCADGYAFENFTAGAGGQEAPFFFKQTATSWTLLEGGDSIPTIACTVIPTSTMTKLDYTCPAAAGPQPSSVTPGQDTPQAVVAAIYQAEITGDWTTACGLVTPDVQATCNSLEDGNPAADSGSHFTVGRAVIQGNEALVEVRGSMCFSGSCGQVQAMPASPGDFQTVFDSVVASSASILSPVPCVNIGSKWYVKLTA
jgi:hypothetical protein